MESLLPNLPIVWYMKKLTHTSWLSIKTKLRGILSLKLTLISKKTIKIPMKYVWDNAQAFLNHLLKEQIKWFNSNTITLKVKKALKLFHRLSSLNPSKWAEFNHKDYQIFLSPSSINKRFNLFEHPKNKSNLSVKSPQSKTLWVSENYLELLKQFHGNLFITETDSFLPKKASTLKANCWIKFNDYNTHNLIISIQCHMIDY